MVNSPTKVPFSQYRELLVKYMAPQRRAGTLLAVLLLGNVGLQLVGPQILRHFIDSLQAGTALVRLIAVALVQQVVSVPRNRLHASTYWSCWTESWTIWTTS